MTLTTGQKQKEANRPPRFVGSLGMKMIRIKAQPFDAWTPSFENVSETQGRSRKWSGTFGRPVIPQRVELEANYYLGEFPVTNRMYRRFVEETGHREPGGLLFDMDRVQQDDVRAWEMEEFSADDQAVSGLSLTDVDAFCAWLSAKEGRTYRLPGIYEWEYACRAGIDTLFWWGDRPDPRYMNYAVSRIGHPTPVGFYPPNPWGFFDMHGNVWEPCPCADEKLVCIRKGGAWNCPPDCLGADAFRGSRIAGMAERQLMNTGLRLACDAAEGGSRPSDIETPVIVSAGGTGPRLGALEITEGDPIDLGTGPSSKPKFFVTNAGTWVVNDRRSEDQGTNWQPCHLITDNNLQLRDGVIMQVDAGFRRPDLERGRGTVTVTVSSDDWQTVEQFEAPLHIPLGLHFNCGTSGVCPKGLIELDDGRLLLAMSGRMDGDDVLMQYPIYPLAGQGMAYKGRLILVESLDRGSSWHYHCTVANRPEMAREGCGESSFVRLPTGDLFAAIRTGNLGYCDDHGREHLDEPMLFSWSRCDGKQWSVPTRLYLEDKLIPGIYPTALVTGEGVLALMRTRPCGSVVFNPDGSGTIWTHEVTFGAPDQRNMAVMQLIGTHTLLVVYRENPQDGAGSIAGLPITVRKV